MDIKTKDLSSVNSLDRKGRCEVNIDQSDDAILWTGDKYHASFIAKSILEYLNCEKIVSLLGKLRCDAMSRIRVEKYLSSEFAEYQGIGWRSAAVSEVNASQGSKVNLGIATSQDWEAVLPTQMCDARLLGQ